MKAVVVFALLALAYAAEKKEDQKPAEKQADERKGLQWPLPDSSNEGDLMLHGVQFFQRVGQLRSAQNVNSDTDKMVLAFGRDFLRRAQKYLASTPDFKILSTLCRDSRSLNSSDRWEIRIQEEAPVAPQQQDQQQKPQNDAPQTKGQDQQQKQNDPPQQPDQQQPEQKPEQPIDHPRSKAKPDSSDDANANATNATNANETHDQIPKQRDQVIVTYESQKSEFYDRMGANFAQLLMKKYRKEALIAEESEYLARWETDAAVHYGAMGIYCWNGEENVKSIVAKLNAYTNEKQ